MRVGPAARPRSLSSRKQERGSGGGCCTGACAPLALACLLLGALPIVHLLAAQAAPPAGQLPAAAAAEIGQPRSGNTGLWDNQKAAPDKPDHRDQQDLQTRTSLEHNNALGSPRARRSARGQPQSTDNGLDLGEPGPDQFAGGAETNGDDPEEEDSSSASPAAGLDQLGASNEPNETESQCESLEDILAARPSPGVGLFFGLNYSLIFAFGLFGNVVTLYVLVCKGTSKCTVQDILIANLACSDIMLCVFAVPITPKYLILDGHWTLGSALCKVVSFAQSTSVYMSTYSLICIGYIRYRLIVHPLGKSMSKRTALLSCLGTWLVGIMVTLPYMLQVRLSPDNCPIKFCDEAWEKPYRFIFSLFTAFFQFMIPLGSVGFFNKKIYSRLDGRGRKGSGDGGGGGGGSVGKVKNDLSNSNNLNQAQALPTAIKSTTTTTTSNIAPASLQAASTSCSGSSGGATNTSGRPQAGAHPERAQNGGQQRMAPNLNCTLQSIHEATGDSQQSQTSAPILDNNSNSNLNTSNLLSERQLDVIAMKEQRRREKERRMRKANNRLIFVVLIFAHSWLPLNLFNIAQDYFEAMLHWPYLTNTFLIVHQIACSSVCWNPILYAWMSETYRQDLRRALPGWLARHFGCLSESSSSAASAAQKQQQLNQSHVQRELLSTMSQRGELVHVSNSLRRPSKQLPVGLSRPLGGGVEQARSQGLSETSLAKQEATTNFVLSPPATPVVQCRLSCSASPSATTSSSSTSRSHGGGGGGGGSEIECGGCR